MIASRSGTVLRMLITVWLIGMNDTRNCGLRRHYSTLLNVCELTTVDWRQQTTVPPIKLPQAFFSFLHLTSPHLLTALLYQCSVDSLAMPIADSAIDMALIENTRGE